MPHTVSDKKKLASMKKTYGPKKGKQVFYALSNSGKLGRASKKRHQRKSSRTMGRKK